MCEYLKKNLICLVILLLYTTQVYAFELDASVDDEIRRNYNPSALENNLPALPKTAVPSKPVSTTPTAPKTLPVAQPAKPQMVVKKRYVTIPAGTAFNAVVTNSHTPQAAGNGGLLEIAVDSINFQGRNHYAQGKVTKANNKKIFLNNIKGKHQYWKGVANQVNKGENFYKKTRRTSAKLSNNPLGQIISPIPTVVGMGVYAVNLVGSPIFSIGSKGGKISIPAGSEFEIKLQDDIYLE